MTITGWLRAGLAAAGMAAAMAAGGGAVAGEAEAALLQGFTGSFSGKGVLIEPGKRTEFDCKLTVGKGNRGKIVFRAQCPLVAGSGGIGFNDGAGRFEIAMTSSTDFGGSAAGRRDGDAVVFVVDHIDTDRKNNTLALKATTRFSANEIAINFDATYNADPWTGSLTFKRSGG